MTTSTTTAPASNGHANGVLSKAGIKQSQKLTDGGAKRLDVWTIFTCVGAADEFQLAS